MEQTVVGLLTKAVYQHMGFDDDETADLLMQHEKFGATMREVAEHGAESGFRGFTYYEDAAAFYDDHHELIWAVLGDKCDALGYEPSYTQPLTLLANLNDARYVWDDRTFKNVLAWYALEYVAAHNGNV